MNALPEELAAYLDAHYPLVVVETGEEDRLNRALIKLCRDKGVAHIALSPLGALQDTHAPHHMLEEIAAYEEPAIFSLPDCHPYMENARFVRRLKELRPTLERRRQSLVFISYGLRVPPEISGDVVHLHLPLPSAEMLHSLLQDILKETRTQAEEEIARGAVRAVQGLSAAAARRAFIRVCHGQDILGPHQLESLLSEKRRVLERSDLLEFVDSLPAMQTIGGLERLKRWLTEREAAFSERARRFGLPSPRGLLLVGVQGCGKSLSAKAVAHLWNLPLARLDMGALFTTRHSPEENLRRVIHLCEALSPVVLWIDELDKAFSQTGNQGDASHAALTRVFATFITWLQEKRSPVFVVATANDVTHLPPELLRTGRFDEIFFVDLPSIREREESLGIHLEAHGRSPGAFALDQLASATEQMSGAELEQVVVAGLYRAFRQERSLTQADLAHAAESLIPLAITCEAAIKVLRDWAPTRARPASDDTRLARLWDKGTSS